MHRADVGICIIKSTAVGIWTLYTNYRLASCNTFNECDMIYCLISDVIMVMSSNGNISALLAFCAGISPVTGEFPAQRQVTRSFGVFFNLRLNKRLNKQSWVRWFETSSCPLWRRCNVCSSRLVPNHFLHLHTNQVHISRDALSSANEWHGTLAQLHDDRYTIYVYKFCHTRVLAILGRSCRGLNTSNETF